MQIDFTVMGLSDGDSETLNWCVKHLENLEVMKKKEVFEIWEEKDVEGTASLSFNKKGVLLRVNRNLFD